MSFYYLSKEMGLALNDILGRTCSYNKDFSIEDISITWINYKSENKSVFKGFGTGINNKKMVYPASIVKLVYGLAAFYWIKKGSLILLPPSLSKGSYLKNFKNIQTAFASGWMSIRALRKRSGYDKGFAISDHADWDGILEVVKKSEAKNVFFHHGDSEAISKYLVEKESINVLFFGK